MRTRTRLTTPAGEEPSPPPSAVSDEGTPSVGEGYVPGFALPEEPHPPSRYRKAVVIVTVLVVLAALAWGVLEVVTAGEDFDPAVDDNPAVPAEPLPDGGEGGTGGVTDAGTGQG